MEGQTCIPLGAPSSPTQQVTPTSKKRNYDGEIIHHSAALTSLSSLTPPCEQQSSPFTTNDSGSGSPEFSEPGTPLTDLGPTPALSPSHLTMTPADSKKRKLTFAEREVEKAVKKRERDEKEKQKAEAKAKKDEEKAKKDEEKKRKDEEREAARKVKEDKKKEKEAEKERKVANALKKERSQMRIGAFFGRTAPASSPPATPEDVSVGSSSRRASITSIDMGQPALELKSSKFANPEYSKWILPFFVNEHTRLAPFNRFRTHSNPFEEEDLPLNQDIVPETLNTRFRRRARARTVRPVKQILETLNGSSDAPIDLTVGADELAKVPYKYLFFHQDVRPPYHGTYTRAVSPRTARKIALNPSLRALPDTDYDYDSEAEWQEPEEGDDDLMDEDEKSEDEDGEEEMDDFLDDEGEVVKRQMLVGDMEPKSSGLCWEGEDSLPQDGFDLSTYRMDVLHDSTMFPIDPFCTRHWTDIGKPSPSKRDKTQQSVGNVSMQPPRLPLAAVDANSGNLLPLANPLNAVCDKAQPENMITQKKSKTNGNNGSGKPLKLIPADLLPAFREAVSGSTLTKTGLIEVLKNQFPKCSKDGIKNSLESIAERRGTKEVEKKWILND